MRCICGFENSATARFCGSCGSPLAPTPTDVAPRTVPKPTPLPRRSSRGRLLGVLAAAFLLSAAGGYWWWLHRPLGRHKHDNSGLYRISVNGKQGFMNRAGKTVISPQFDGAYGFSEGLAAVKVGTKFGFINTKGEVVITPQFDLVFPFSEGLAGVQVGTKFGYINKKGLVTITPQFDDATPFHNGRAAVKLEGGRSWNGLDTKVGHAGNNRYGFIDKEGKYIGMPGLLFVQPSYGDDTGWGGDVTLIRTADDRIGIMSGSGKVLIADKVDEVGWDGFADGLAPAASGGKWGYLNPKGEWVITPQFESVHGFDDGLAPVKIGQHWGLIDRGGKFVVNPQYDHVFGISEGYAIVESGTGTIPGCPQYCSNYSFIRTNGQPVGAATFTQHPNPDGSYSSPVRAFSEGLAAVKTDDGWGFIDGTGKMIIAPQFDEVGSFQDGLAYVKVLGREAYITKGGAFVVNPFPGTTVSGEKARIVADLPGTWQIPEGSKGHSTCGDLTIKWTAETAYSVDYGWCSDERETGTLLLINGQLVGAVIDNMMGTRSKCEIGFQDDRKTISVKTIWPSQEPSVDYYKKVNVPPPPKVAVSRTAFSGTWRVTTCCNQYWPYRITDRGDGTFQLDRGVFRGDGTENYEFSQPLVLQLVNGKLEFEGPQGDTGYRSRIVIEIGADDEMVFKEYVGGVVASPYKGPRISGHNSSTASNTQQLASSSFLDRFRDIDARELTIAELEPLTAADLGILRNFVFARHGRVFAKPKYRDYFSQFSWYRPDSNYSDRMLNAIERRNVEVIAKREGVAEDTP